MQTLWCSFLDCTLRQAENPSALNGASSFSPSKVCGKSVCTASELITAVDHRDPGSKKRTAGCRPRDRMHACMDADRRSMHVIKHKQAVPNAFNWGSKQRKLTTTINAGAAVCARLDAHGHKPRVSVPLAISPCWCSRPRPRDDEEEPCNSISLRVVGRPELPLTGELSC